MEQKNVAVALMTGIQARPAAQFVEKANRFLSGVYLEKDGKRVNAKSIMGMMSLAVREGETITLIAEGPDEQEAVRELAAFVSPSSHLTG